jgi:hypothetical protein
MMFRVGLAAFGRTGGFIVFRSGAQLMQMNEGQVLTNSKVVISVNKKSSPKGDFAPESCA